MPARGSASNRAYEGCGSFRNTCAQREDRPGQRRPVAARARLSFDVTSALEQLASSQHFSASLASLEPAPLPYRRLKEALAQYRNLAQQASLTSSTTAPGRSLAQGAEYAGAPALRRLLEVLGDLTATSTTARRDEQTIDARTSRAYAAFNAVMDSLSTVCSAHAPLLP